MSTNSLLPQSKVGSRQHNLELLRITAMLMVLLIHYNLPVRGKPTPDTLQSDFIFSSVTIVLQSLLIVCVNCFVLISGWFGIRWKRRSLLNLVFQIVFWAVVCYPLLCLLPHSVESGVTGYAHSLLFKWFVWAYFGLYLFAPVLNDFIDKSSTQRLWKFVVAFYVFSTLFGYFSKAVADFNEGMSVLSLIGLYLLGALLRRTESRLPKRAAVWLGGYLLCALILIGLTLLVFHFGIVSTPMGYLNPIFIVESVCLFLFVQRLRVNCRAILFFSSSAYAVYLAHVFPGDCYRTALQSIVDSGMNCWAEGALIVGFVVAVFVAAVLVDKVRIALFAHFYPQD